ncbi:phosphotransferase enzyme family-domain-containing protein [Xylariales sp. PMI_506]|nr:phosphotransferase enzyme family-domain-containing protein [Xylariales sp. PMI_506]
MGWSEYLPQDRIKWTDGLDSYPIWPSEPEIAVIKDVVAPVLPEKKNEFSVQFLADGAHHKIYEVSSSSWVTTYLFRIAVAVDPQFKMESEIATLKFLRQRTGIPVPKPIAWSSSTEGKLGYEWALVEKVPGVELREVWHKVPWDKKIQITETIAGFLVQLWSPGNRLDSIGSLYLKSTEPSNSAGEGTGAESFSKNGFTIGPSVDGAFFVGRRRYLPSKRGPDSRRYDAGAQSRRWETLVDEIGVDEEEFIDEYGDMVATCVEYERVLPLVFPGQKVPDGDKSRFSLHHCDLREANIIVDPDTFTITGIIDWEQTCSLPRWYCVDYPLLINKDEPINDGEPPVPKTYNVDDAEYSPAKVAERDRWDAKVLRAHFDAAVEQLLGTKDWRPATPQDLLKSRFIQGVGNLSDNWERARNQIKSITKDLESLHKEAE